MDFIVSDMHGNKNFFQALLYELEDHGWFLSYSKNGYDIYLDNKKGHKLYVLGDNNDRGEYSAIVSYLIASSFVHNPEKVICTLGNHDTRITDYYKYGILKNTYDFKKTVHQIDNTLSIPQLRTMINGISSYHLFVETDSFIGVHAFYDKDTTITKELAIYGPVIKFDDVSMGLLPRVPWWEEVERAEKPIVFGHYHAQMDMLWPDKNLYCIDNLDSGVYTIGVVKEGLLEIRLINKGTKPTNMFKTILKYLN